MAPPSTVDNNCQGNNNLKRVLGRFRYLTPAFSYIGREVGDLSEPLSFAFHGDDGVVLRTCQQSNEKTGVVFYVCDVMFSADENER